MRKFIPVEKARESILKLEGEIYKLISRDLQEIESCEISLDVWMEKFSRNKNYQDKKEVLHTLEMELLDAQILLQHSEIQKAV